MSKNQIMFTIKENSCNAIKKGIPTPRHQYQNIKYLTCMCNFHDPQIYTYIELAQEYKNIGPNPNIYMYLTNKISAKMMNYIRFINNFIDQKEIEQQKAQQKKLKQKR